MARAIVTRLMGDFRRKYGYTDCRALIGMDISTPEGHATFIEGQIWRTVCMDQINFVLRHLVTLGDENGWRESLLLSA